MNGLLQGLCYLPREIMTKFQLRGNLAIREIKDRKDADIKPLQDTVHDVASQSFAHLDAARKQYQIYCQSQAGSSFGLNTLFRRNMGVYALLPAIATDIYLEKLRGCEFDPFVFDAASANDTPLRLQLRLLYATTRQTI